MPQYHLLSLPQETFDQIIIIVHEDDPEDIIALILTCRAIHRAFEAAGFLEERQEWHQKYKTVSYIMPLTIPRMVSGAIQRPLHEAWHVRRMEIWDRRTDFNDWLMISDLLCYNWTDISPRSLLDSDDTISAGAEGPWKQIKDEQEEARNEVKNDLSYCEAYISNSFEDVEFEFDNEPLNRLLEGDDGIIKAMLMTMCPCLNTVIFM